MGTGILVCGLNGAGKSTLGRALAAELCFRFIDCEELYFSRREKGEPYADPRSREEAERLFWEEVRRSPDFVFAAVRGDWSTAVPYRLVVLLEVPKDLRLQRIRRRSFEKFGERMLPGGDLCEEEEDFFRLAESRPEDHTARWVNALACPVLRLDGTRPVEENVRAVAEWLYKQNR